MRTFKTVQWSLIALVCLLLGTVVMEFAQGAETLKLSWDLPTQRVSGAPLTVDELEKSTLIWVCNGKEGSRDIPTPDTSTMVGKPGPGECLYYVTVTAKDGAVSERSAAYEWLEPKSPPAHPENITGSVNE